MLSLFGIFVSLGVTIGMMESKDGALGWAVLLPFAAGLALGDTMPPRKYVNVNALLAAPFFSAIAVGTIGVTASLHYSITQRQDMTSPYLLQAMSILFFMIPMQVFGVIPAIVGAAVSSALKSLSISKKPIAD